MSRVTRTAADESVACAGGEPAAAGADDLLGRASLPQRDLVFVVVALLVASLLAALDQIIFSTALPTIVGELGGVGQMLWVTTAYMLAGTITMPLYGKLGDLIGHKVLFLLSLVLFMGGSILGGIAGDMTVLITARAVQGLGGGGLMILSLAIIADVVPPRRRGTYMGILGSSWAFSSVLGPILGGWFTDAIGWRWVFWFNLPLGALALISAVAFLKMPRGERERPRLDVAGTATMAVSVSAIILVTSWGGREYDWDSAPILGLLAAAVVFGALFVLAEKRVVQPIVPLHLFRDRNFNLVAVASLFSALAMFGMITYMPSYLQMVTGLSATRSGLLLAPASVGILIASVGSGMLTTRTGRYKWMPIVSCLLVGLGLFLLSTLQVHTSLWTIGGYLVIFGAGQGLAVQIFTLIVQNSFPITEVGTATAANSLFRQMGALLGSAAVGTVFTNRLMGSLAERLAGIPGGEGALVDLDSLTPALMNGMPEAAQAAVLASYSEALTPVFLYLVPMMVIGAIIMCFLEEKPLGAKNVTAAEETAPRPPATDIIV